MPTPSPENPITRSRPIAGEWLGRIGYRAPHHTHPTPQTAPLPEAQSEPEQDEEE